MQELSKKDAEKERATYIKEFNEIIPKIEQQYYDMDLENSSIDAMMEDSKAEAIKVLTIVIELLNRTTFMSVED